MRSAASVLVLCSVAAFAQGELESRSAESAAGLRYEAGGPSAVGDPIQVGTLSVMHDETDLVIRTGIGDFALSRKYSSLDRQLVPYCSEGTPAGPNTPPTPPVCAAISVQEPNWGDVWPQRLLFGYQLNQNGMTGTTQWWSGLSSYASLRIMPGGEDDGFIPQISVQVREPSGDTIGAENLAEQLEAGAFDFVDVGGGVRIVLDGPRVPPQAPGAGNLIWTQVETITVFRNGVGRFKYIFDDEESWPVTTQDDAKRRRYRLFAVYPDSLEPNPAPICTVSPNGNTLQCFGGIVVTLVRGEAGSNASPDQVSSLWLGTSGGPSEKQLEYRYDAQTHHLASVTNVVSGEKTSYRYDTSDGGAGFRLSKSTTTDERLVFEKVRAGTRNTCRFYYSDGGQQVAVDQVLRVVSSEGTPAGGFSYEPQYPEGQGGYSGIDAGLCFTGDRFNVAEQIGLEGARVRQTFRTSGGSTSQVDLTCQSAGGQPCSAVSNATARWSTDHFAEPIDTLRVDYRGSRTRLDVVHRTSGVDPNFIKDTEVTRVRSGASDDNATDPLLTTDYTWQYADGARTHQRLPETASQASVVQTSGTTTTRWRYDLATKQLQAVIKTGWTRTLTGTPEQKHVATFTFDRHACTPGATPDPHGRTLEVHGPCFVQNANSLDCDGEGGAAVPVTRFTYYADNDPVATRRGRLWKKTVLVGGPTTGMCNSSMELTTEYLSYDARGNVLEEQDPNGTTTTRVFDGDRLVSELVTADGVSAKTRYFYHPTQGGRLSAKQLPSGQWEVYCWRLNAAADCRSGGTPADQMQWKARLRSVVQGNGEPTDFAAEVLEKTVYTYTPRPGALAGAGGGLLTRETVYGHTLVSGVPMPDLTYRRVKGLAYDPLGRVSATRALDPSGASLYESASLFDEAGNVLGEGAAFNTPPAGCGGQVHDPSDGAWKRAASDECTRFRYDRLNRLDKVDTFRFPGQGGDPGRVRTSFAYDAHGNVRTVEQDPGGRVVTYQHDDFGNVIDIQGQWMTTGSIKQAFDARGNLVAKSTPAMNGRKVEYVYDTLNRPLRASITSAPGTLLWAYGYDGDTRPDTNCPDNGTSNLKGRAQWKDDSFGRTWYRYDGLGNVLELRRVRDGGPGCSVEATQSSNETPDTLYRYSSDGRLLAMKYPHGLWLRYRWATPVPDRIVALDTGHVDPDFADESDWQPLIFDIRYDVDGSIEAYELATTGSPTSVEWLRRGSANITPLGCSIARPTADGTGRLWGLWVSRESLTAPESGRTGNVFKRYFQWNTDQLFGQATCLVGETTPRTEFFGYDATLQVTNATRPANEFNSKGGAWGKREFLYTRGSDREWATEDCVGWRSEYDSKRRLTEVHPRANTCTGTCTTERSWGAKLYQYDADGRVVELEDTPWAGGAGQGAGRHIVFTPDDGFGSVYQAVQVNDATYQYLYDAQGRRRLKVYPVNDARDEYFYEGDHLIEDVGMTSLVDTLDERHMLNQYVWLGGMPVAVLKTTTDKDVVPVASPSQCQRNDEAEPCGTYFIVNDYLPKPVALIDSEGRLAGSGDYDVFGRVNEVTVSQDTPAWPGTPPQPFGAYLPSKNIVLAYLKQPATSASLAVQLRVRYAAINTGSAGDFTWVEDGTTGAALTPAYQGWVLGEKTTPWLPVGAGGLVHVRWQSDSIGEPRTYSGVTVGSYEYRRYEVGASPWWVPLRFPGQYADAESGLFENWNRFFDPGTGRYSASDPQWLGRKPKAAWFKATPGPNAFVYVDNKPLLARDPTGLKLEYDKKNLTLVLAIAEMRKNKKLRTLLDKMDADKKNIFRLEVRTGDQLKEFGGGLTSPATPNSLGGKTSESFINLEAHYMSLDDKPTAAKWLAPHSWESLASHELGHGYANVYGGDSDRTGIDWENEIRPGPDRPYTGGPSGLGEHQWPVCPPSCSP